MIQRSVLDFFGYDVIGLVAFSSNRLDREMLVEYGAERANMICCSVGTIFCYLFHFHGGDHHAKRSNGSTARSLYFLLGSLRLGWKERS